VTPDDGLGGGIGSGLARFGAFLAAAAILGIGILQREGNTDARWLLALAASAPFFVLLLWPRLPPNLPTFNRTVVRIGTLLVVAFLLTSIHLVRLQVVRADELATESRPTANGDTIVNQRILLEQLRQQRGRIVDRNGQILADTTITPDGFALRSYPSTSSYVVGYYSPQYYGLAGVERAYDRYLRGSSGGNPFETLAGDLLHEPLVGNDVVLTVDLRLQQVADRALDATGRRGAVVALDPRSGAILVNAAAPRFDPQQLAIDPRESEREVARAKAYWSALNAEGSGDPLLPRGTQGLFVPGSTFKTFTVAAALDGGIVSPTKIYPDPGEIVIDGHQIIELNRPEPVKNEYSVTEGYLYSLNIVFAQIALDTGTVRTNEYAKKFGFGEEIPFNGLANALGQRGAASSVSSDPNYLSSKPALADTGFGQGELLTTPLHMALITAAITNGGKMPEPYIVGAARSPGGELLEQTRAKTWLTPISANTADQVRTLMLASVERGGSTRAKIDGLVIGGKTGTAELGDGDSHSWFICFAGKPNGPPEIAMAVIVERGGSGAGAALGIARQVIEAYYAVNR
jgi:peptidoglycan glycosyltransferase